jgi:threonine/homoserine/homoserine lactone efflux protein
MTLWLAAILIGFIFYSQQTVATAIAISQGRRRGFGAAFAVMGGALAGDALWLAAALIVVALASQLEPLRVIFSIVGSFFFLRLAWGALTDARQGATPRQDAPGADAGYRAGMQITLRNPYALGFWVGVATATILASTAQPLPLEYSAFFVGVVMGAALWSGLIAWLVSQHPDRLTAGFFRVVNGVGGMLAVLFGIAVLWATVVR